MQKTRNDTCATFASDALKWLQLFVTFASDRDDFAQIAFLLAVDRDHFKKGMFEKNIGILRILLTINPNDFAFNFLFCKFC